MSETTEQLENACFHTVDSVFVPSNINDDDPLSQSVMDRGQKYIQDKFRKKLKRHVSSSLSKGTGNGSSKRTTSSKSFDFDDDLTDNIILTQSVIERAHQRDAERYKRHRRTRQRPSTSTFTKNIESNESDSLDTGDELSDNDIIPQSVIERAHKRDAEKYKHLIKPRQIPASLNEEQSLENHLSANQRILQSTPQRPGCSLSDNTIGITPILKEHQFSRRRTVPRSHLQLPTKLGQLTELIDRSSDNHEDGSNNESVPKGMEKVPRRSDTFSLKVDSLQDSKTCSKTFKQRSTSEKSYTVVSEQSNPTRMSLKNSDCSKRSSKGRQESYSVSNSDSRKFPHHASESEELGIVTMTIEDESTNIELSELSDEWEQEYLAGSQKNVNKVNAIYRNSITQIENDDPTEQQSTRSGKIMPKEQTMNSLSNLSCHITNQETSTSLVTKTNYHENSSVHMMAMLSGDEQVILGTSSSQDDDIPIESLERLDSSLFSDTRSIQNLQMSLQKDLSSHINNTKNSSGQIKRIVVSSPGSQEDELHNDILEQSVNDATNLTDKIQTPSRTSILKVNKAQSFQNSPSQGSLQSNIDDLEDPVETESETENVHNIAGVEQDDQQFSSFNHNKGLESMSSVSKTNKPIVNEDSDSGASTIDLSESNSFFNRNMTDATDVTPETTTTTSQPMGNISLPATTVQSKSHEELLKNALARSKTIDTLEIDNVDLICNTTCRMSGAERQLKTTGLYPIVCLSRIDVAEAKKQLKSSVTISSVSSQETKFSFRIKRQLPLDENKSTHTGKRSSKLGRNMSTVTPKRIYGPILGYLNRGSSQSSSQQCSQRSLTEKDTSDNMIDNHVQDEDMQPSQLAKNDTLHCSSQQSSNVPPVNLQSLKAPAPPTSVEPEKLLSKKKRNQKSVTNILDDKESLDGLIPEDDEGDGTLSKSQNSKETKSELFLSKKRKLSSFSHNKRHRISSNDTRQTEDEEEKSNVGSVLEDKQSKNFSKLRNSRSESSLATKKVKSSSFPNSEELQRSRNKSVDVDDNNVEMWPCNLDGENSSVNNAFENERVETASQSKNSTTTKSQSISTTIRGEKFTSFHSSERLPVPTSDTRQTDDEEEMSNVSSASEDKQSKDFSNLRNSKASQSSVLATKKVKSSSFANSEELQRSRNKAVELVDNNVDVVDNNVEVWPCNFDGENSSVNNAIENETASQSKNSTKTKSQSISTTIRGKTTFNSRSKRSRISGDKSTHDDNDLVNEQSSSKRRRSQSSESSTQLYNGKRAEKGNSTFKSSRRSKMKRKKLFGESSLSESEQQVVIGVQDEEVSTIRKPSSTTMKSKKPKFILKRFLTTSSTRVLRSEEKYQHNPREKFKTLSQLQDNSNMIPKDYLTKVIREKGMEFSKSELDSLHQYLNNELEALCNGLCEQAARPYGMFTFRQLEDALKKKRLIDPSLGRHSLLIMMASILPHSVYERAKGILIPKVGDYDTH